ncbi:MAG TPA: hypothetical protein VGH27_26545 [Streptosporangiaceae bacterium]|jgi:hypothetical protein
MSSLNWETISSLATAAGTLVLAVATFSSVRSANRTAKAAEESLRVGLRPVLMQSRREDPAQKFMFGDGQWFKLPGGTAGAEIRVQDDGMEVLYLALSLRNAGSGLAVIHGWRFYAERPTGTQQHHPPPEDFRLNTRDLYIPVSDTGFWQAAYRDPEDPEYGPAVEAIKKRVPVSIDLLYGDHEGGQRVVTRFSLVPRDGIMLGGTGRDATAPADPPPDEPREEPPRPADPFDGLWVPSVIRHWNVDRPEVRPGAS